MGQFSFKSTGKTQEQRLVETLERAATPIGIKTPLALNMGEGNDILQTYDNLADCVHDNLRNLLLTNWGSRLGLYKFGANLRPLMAELVSPDDFDSKAIENISDAVNRWMPFVSLETFESNVNRTDVRKLARIDVKITYNVPTLNVKNKMLEINLYAM